MPEKRDSSKGLFANYIDQINSLKTQGFSSPEEADRVRFYFENQTGRINGNLLTTLASYKVTDNDPRLKAKVREGREFLKTTFSTSPIFQPLIENGGGVILYGSLEFNDPRNFDADLLVVNPNKEEVTYYYTPQGASDFNIFDHQLLSDWDRFGSNPHISEVTLPTLEPSVPSSLANLEFYKLHAGHLSVMLSGLVLCSKGAKTVEGWQSQARTVLESRPLLAAFANVHLEDTIQIRQERRTK